jgi:hypothetical protein
MPTRCIHSKSAVIPSRVIRPFIQCHQVCGRADAGGTRNEVANGSARIAAAQSSVLTPIKKQNQNRAHLRIDHLPLKCMAHITRIGPIR